MPQDHAAAPLAEEIEADDDRDILVAIENQTRTTLELVRSLVALMMPKGDRTGPTLEQMLANIMAQQREIIRQIQESRDLLSEIGNALPQAVAEAVATADGEVSHRMHRPC
jgi:hypothetical protein